jgi:hypothetical protein
MLRERMALEGEDFVRQLKSPEFMQAFTAFAQRRAADFSKFR